MGRPKRGEAKNHSAHIRVGMTPELRAAIDARVVETGNTIVDVILPVLEREFLGKKRPAQSAKAEGKDRRPKA